MPQPRAALISLEDTPYYHCVSRCVRRAYLCGEDQHSGRSFEHRRGWIEQRLLKLGQCFAVDVCAYAVMSNHTHLVLLVNVAQAKQWAMVEVIERWHRLFSGTPLSQRYLRGDRLTKEELILVERVSEQWRARLMSVSWFMRCLNEHIARLANTEDQCTGRFWEGRFKSQALLDEAALVACLAYVDLNPVRAGIAKTPEDSDHTSIQRRIQTLQKAESGQAHQPVDLAPFVGHSRQDIPTGLPFHLEDYLNLVDQTGRQLRDDKYGAIDDSVPQILLRLGISSNNWLSLTQRFEEHFKGIAGRPDEVQQACVSRGIRWTHGMGAARRLLAR